MEFDRYLLQLQGCMISAQNNLLGLCEPMSDADKSHILVEKVKKVIKNWPVDYDSRKVCLYMICNCDLESLHDFSESDVIGHIIGSAPCFNKHVMLRTILGLDLTSCLHDLIVFGPHVLSAEVLETFINVGTLDTGNLMLKSCTIMITACFKKLLLCEVDDLRVPFRFFYYFKQLLNKILGLKPPDKSSPCELYQLSGDLALSFIEICRTCVKWDTTALSESWEYYQLSTDSTTFDQWPVPENEVSSFDDMLWHCRNLMFSTCTQNLSEVSLDVWLSWVEVDVTPSITMQQCVGEAAFKCHEELKIFVNETEQFDCLTDMLNILSQMGIKPKCEEDEVVGADLSVIIQNLGDENKCKKVWFKGLLQHKEVFESDSSLEAIQNHSILIDDEDAIFLINTTVSKLRAVKETNSLVCKLISFLSNVMKHFTPESHINIIEKIISTNKIKEDLWFECFPSILFSVFNKMVNSQQDENKLICEALQLCIFNMKAVVEEAVRIGLEEKTQCVMMVKFLTVSKKISQSAVKEWLQNFDSSCIVQESQFHNFPLFVSELVKKEILTMEFFMKNCAMPALHIAFNNSQLKSVVMWISSVELLVENVPQDFRWAPLLAFIGQIMRQSLQTLYTFKIQCIEVRAACLSLLNALRRVKLDVLEQHWLSTQIIGQPSINFCYLVTFIDDFPNNDHPVANNWQCLVLKYCLPTKIEKAEEAACTLIQILPSMTMSEWIYLASHLKEHSFIKEDKCLIVFRVYRQFMLLIAAVSCSHDKVLDGQLLSCLNYCVRSFGLVMQDIILPSLDCADHLLVLMETLHMLSKFPTPVWERAAIFLSPLLMSLIQSTSYNSTAFIQLQSVFAVCPECETRTLIETKLTELSKKQITHS